MLVLLAVMSLSCSDDNDQDNNNQNTTVEYRVTVDAPIITSVMFRNSDGEMEEGFTTESDPSEWIGALDVDPPYNAHVVATFNNPGMEVITGSVSIYVDDEFVTTVPVSVPAAAMITVTADHDIE